MTEAILEDLAAALMPLGMQLRGGFSASLPEDALPQVAAERPTRTLLLVGNVGPAMYGPFFEGREAAEGIAHPLDSWTERMLEPIAAQFDARAVFPFGGPPWHPFQRWAKRAEGLRASPLGILIHPKFGLWHAYRAALLFDRGIAVPTVSPATHPCDACSEKPCLSTCPVGAFTPGGYDVRTCAGHVSGNAGSACRSGGCLARRACPVGREYLYPTRAMEFHMAAFRKGHAAGN
jgi:hypothetical protein